MRWQTVLLLALLFAFAPPTDKAKPPGTKPALPAGKPTPPPASDLADAMARVRRLALVAPPPPALPRATVESDASKITAALPKIWRGCAPDPDYADTLPPRWETFGAKLATRSATLFRLRLLTSAASAPNQPDGTPALTWETAGSLLKAITQAGENAIVEVIPPPPTSTPDAWRATLERMAKRYGADPSYGVARWELGAAASQLAVWYAPFAKTLRAVLPSTPVGLHLLVGDATEGAQALAARCRQDKLPCDTFSWRLAGNPALAGETVRQVRAGFLHVPELKSVLLLPELSGEQAEGEEKAASLIATAARIVDIAPSNEPNGALGALVTVPMLLRGSERGAIWNALTLLNRVSGSRLAAKSDERGVGCLVARSRGSVFALLWRQPEDLRPADVLTTLHLHNLPKSARGGYRLERYDAEAGPTESETLSPTLRADLPVGNDSGEVEIPLLLSPHAVTLLELKPHPQPPFEVSLWSPRFSWNSGDPLELRMRIRNLSKTPQRIEIELSSNVSGLIAGELARRRLGVLPPNGEQLLRYQLTVPFVRQDTDALFNVRVGGADGGCTSLSMQFAAPLALSLETPCVDMEAGRNAATATVKLVNRGRAPVSVQLRSSDGTPDRFTLPATGLVRRPVRVRPSGTDPGLYPVEIRAQGQGVDLPPLRVLVGVPVVCRYATLKPTIDGDLKEWTDAVPIGIGQREQMRDKNWAGPNDLSATSYVKWDEQFFYFACDVTDDVLYPPTAAPELQRGDSVQFVLSADRHGAPARSGYGPGDYEFGITLLNGNQPVLYRFAPNARLSVGTIAVKRVGNRTLYEAAIPWSQLAPLKPKPGAAFGFSLVVNDNDGAGRGYGVWGEDFTERKRPGLFPPLRLVR